MIDYSTLQGCSMSTRADNEIVR